MQQSMFGRKREILVVHEEEMLISDACDISAFTQVQLLFGPMVVTLI